MTEKHFRCTACGKCCHGWLPLTLADALANAGRFPLAIVWTPIKQGSKAFDLTAKLGVTMRLQDKKQVAIRIMPTAYVPPSLPCPALTPDNLCGIQEAKPLRCRTMPFFPYAEEASQAEQLVPRSGWTCDISVTAPVVYRDKAILDRADFDREREELIRQTPLLRKYAENLAASIPTLSNLVMQAARKPGGGHVVLSFASLLRHLRDVDKESVAIQQAPVLAAFEAKVAERPELAEYLRNYRDWAWEIGRYCPDAVQPIDNK